MKIRFKTQRIWKPRLFRLGIILTLLVIATDYLDVLGPFENILYDRRARLCQRFTVPPTDRLVHIDIDDDSLNEMGAWPWPRARLAQIIDEIELANPKVVGLDMYFPESQEPRSAKQADGSVATVLDDDVLAASFKRAGNILLPISIQFAAKAASDPLLSEMQTLLRADLELEPEEVVTALRERGINPPDLTQQVTLLMSKARKEAMINRLNAEIESSDADLPTLRKRLVPRSEESGIHTDASKLLDARYPIAMAIRATRRFRLPLPAGVQLYSAPGENDVNIVQLAQAVHYSGFVDLPPSGKDGTVRSVPLLVNYRGGGFPHMALAMACALLDVKLEDIKCTPNSIVLPIPGRVPIVIPARSAFSAALGNVGAVVDVPYFGKPADGWLTMYDFPRYQQAASHLSIRVFWTLLLRAESIRHNNATADQILKDVSGTFSFPKLDSYLEKVPDVSDTAARLAMIDATMKQLAEQGLTELLTKPEKDLDPDYKPLAAKLKVLQSVAQVNRESVALLVKDRLDMQHRLQGKAIIIDWTAEGRVDFYPTSLHAQCPGAVIQGTIINGILTRDLWRRPPLWITALITFGVGLLTTLLVATLPPWRALIFTLLVMSGYALVNGEILFDYGNLIVGAAGPLTACALVWGGLTLTNFITEAREKARIRKQFTSYIDPAIVEFYEEHPEIDGAVGQRREMTVVFTDLAGFTTISEKLGESTVGLLNEFFGKMVPVVRANNGVVNKFLGDGLMFFYNAPRDNPNHAADAVQTVLEMRKVLMAFNKVIDQRGLPPVGMRAGMTTGAMIVGDAGSKAEDEKNNANDYTVLGDKVNLAARLEGANKVFGSNLLMNQETRDAIGNQFLCRKIGRIQVKGKSEYVMCHEAICTTTEANAEHTAHAALSTKIVDAFQAGEFDRCLRLCDDLESQFKDASFAEAYRDECERHLEKRFKGEFAGQIILSEK